MKNGITLFLLLVASALFCVPSECGFLNFLSNWERQHEWYDKAPSEEIREYTSLKRQYKIIELPVGSAQCMCKSNVYHVARTKKHRVFHRNIHRDESKRDGAVFWQFLVWHSNTKNVYLDVYFEGFRRKQSIGDVYEVLKKELSDGAENMDEFTRGDGGVKNRDQIKNWLINKMKKFDETIGGWCDFNSKRMIKAQFVFTLRIEECGGEGNKLNRIRTWTANLTRKNVHLFQLRERSSPYLSTLHLNGPPTNFLNHNQKRQKRVDSHIGLENNCYKASVDYADWVPSVFIPVPLPAAHPEPIVVVPNPSDKVYSKRNNDGSVFKPSTYGGVTEASDDGDVGVAEPSTADATVNGGLILYGSRTVNPDKNARSGKTPKGMKPWKLHERKGPEVNHIFGWISDTKSTFATVMPAVINIIQSGSTAAPVNKISNIYASSQKSRLKGMNELRPPRFH